MGLRRDDRSRFSAMETRRTQRGCGMNKMGWFRGGGRPRQHAQNGVVCRNGLLDWPCLHCFGMSRRKTVCGTVRTQRTRRAEAAVCDLERFCVCVIAPRGGKKGDSILSTVPRGRSHFVYFPLGFYSAQLAPRGLRTPRSKAGSSGSKDKWT